MREQWKERRRAASEGERKGAAELATCASDHRVRHCAPATRRTGGAMLPRERREGETQSELRSAFIQESARIARVPAPPSHLSSAASSPSVP